MAEQLTIRLPTEMYQALADAADRLRRNRSELVRLAIEEYLGLGQRAESRPAERVKPLLGSLDSGTPDLAEKHREYVLQSLKNGG